MHPHSKHWHLKDYILVYILVYKRDQNSILHTRVMPNIECYRNSQIVNFKLSIHLFKSNKVEIFY